MTLTEEGSLQTKLRFAEFFIRNVCWLTTSKTSCVFVLCLFISNSQITLLYICRKSSQATSNTEGLHVCEFEFRSTSEITRDSSFLSTFALSPLCNLKLMKESTFPLQLQAGVNITVHKHPTKEVIAAMVGLINASIKLSLTSAPVSKRHQIKAESDSWCSLLQKIWLCISLSPRELLYFQSGPPYTILSKCLFFCFVGE